MTYKVILTKEFIKDIRKLDISIQYRVRNKINEVALNPERYKHMHYSYSGSCRIRVGKLRILYSYDIEKMEMYLEQIVFKHKY